MFIKTNKCKNKGQDKEYVSQLLVENYWEDGKSKTKTILNLSKLPTKLQLMIEQTLSQAKKEGTLVKLEDIAIETSIDYGWYFVVKKVMEDLKIKLVIEKVCADKANLVILMIIGKIITRGSKLGILNWIRRNEYIAQELNIDTTKLTEKDLYGAMSDFYKAQEKLEKEWAKKHAKKLDKIYLYDITSLYFEGSQNELAAFGYDRDKKKGKKILTVGLVTTTDGFPIKIKVFKGNTLDHQTIKNQLIELKEQYHSKEIVLVGDRGMKIKYNLENLVANNSGIQYITGLTTDEIRNLEQETNIQLSFFDKQVVEIEQNDKRYILSLNPVLEAEKQENRLRAKLKFENEISLVQKSYNTEKERCENNVQKLDNGHKNKKLKIEISDKQFENWNYRIRKAQEKYRMQKVYTINITKEKFSIEYNPLYYEELGKYDGKYVFETTVKKEELEAEEVRNVYKKLQKVEHAFKVLKTDRINLRPIFHRNEDTTRAHILIGMFTYAIINEIEQKIYPWLKTTTNQNKISFTDIIEELKSIKLNILSFGKNTHREIRITNFNNIQKEIFGILGFKNILIS